LTSVQNLGGDEEGKQGPEASGGKGKGDINAKDKKNRRQKVIRPIAGGA